MNTCPNGASDGTLVITVMAAVPLFPLPLCVAVIVADPGPTPVTNPLPLTAATVPSLVAQVTDRPESGFPLPSRAVAESCTVPPTGRLAVAGVTVTDATGTSVAVAVNVMAGSPPTLAVRVFVPGVGPRVQLPTVAIPSRAVVGDAPVTLPPPEATAKATGTPGTRFWNWSRTTTDGGVPTAVPAGAVWPSPPLSDPCAGAPG